MNTSYQRSIWVIQSKIPLSYPLNLHSQGFSGREYFQLMVNCFLTPLTKKLNIQRCVTVRHSQKTIFENTFFWPAPLFLYFYMYHYIPKGKFWRNVEIPWKRIIPFISFFQLLRYLQFWSQKLRLRWPKVHWSVWSPSDCDLHKEITWHLSYIPLYSPSWHLNPQFS